MSSAADGLQARLTRRRLLAALSAATLSACAARPGARRARVLFVGNSLTYYNDLPGQFAQLAELSLGRPVESVMLAQGGARLDQHQAAGVVARELGTRCYSALVLQEWGRGLLCRPGFARFGFDCEASRAAHRSLVGLAESVGVQTVLLGTYSTDRDDALSLMREESRFAGELGAAHVGLGDFPELRDRHPDWTWLDPDDGQHPGPELTLLMALRLTARLFSAAPPVAETVLRVRSFRGKARPRLGIAEFMHSNPEPILERWLSASQMAERLDCALRHSARLVGHRRLADHFP